MRLAGALAVILFLAACVPQKKKPAPKSAAKAAPSVNTAAAQKRAYDLGTKHFGEERYAEAKKAWQEAVRLGPATALGRKAQENVQRVNSILAGLRDLEK